MIHTDRRFEEAVEAAVSRLEQRTDAEVVVVAAERSGTYRDVAVIGASAIALVLLAVMLYVPYMIPPWAVVVELAVAWIAVAWLISGPRALRLLVSDERLHRQARTAAEAEFVHEAVYATPQRTGVLVYVSALEGRVEVLPDVGIEGRIPLGAWRKATRDFVHDDLDHFVAGLESMGELLAAHVPPVDDPDRIELDDAPRVRS